MRKATLVGKKAISIILSIAMLLTTFVFFNIGSLIGSAADYSSAITVSSNTSSNVYFYVPETVYLAPDMTSYTNQGRYNFQWFVDSSIDTTTHTATLRKGENPTGNFYFYYKDASQVSVSYKYLKADYSEMAAYTNTSTTNTSADYVNSNCTIKLEAYSTPLRAANTNASSSYNSYTVNGNTINTTMTRAGLSPFLLAKTSGCIIEWTAKFVDSKDGLVKTAYAYTYVYKPYVQSVGAGTRTVNNRGDNSYGQSIAWISGVHSVAAGGSNGQNSVKGSKSFVPFASSNAQGVQLGEAGTKLYAQFASDNQSNTYFNYTGMNNAGLGEWINSGNNTYLKDLTFNYINNNVNGSNTGDNAFYTLCTAPTANLTVDVSRYNVSLKDIPNLSAGLLVTDDEGSKSGQGAWYVADGTGKNDSAATIRDYEKNSTKNSSSLYDNYKKLIANQGSFTSRGAYEVEGCKYLGPIDVAILNTSNATNMYKVRTVYHNADSSSGGDRITNVVVMPISVVQVNKANLRAAMYKATFKTAQFGLKVDGTSAYCNSSSENWAKFTSLYRAAGRLLSKLDGAQTISASYNGITNTYNPDTLASALNSAVSAVENEVKASSAKVRFVSLRPTDSGYTVLNVYDAKASANVADGSKAYKYGENLKFTAPSFIGYKYVGYKAGLTSVNSTISGDYTTALDSTETTVSNNYVSEDNVSYTFYYVEQNYEAIVDTKGGEFNLLKGMESKFPSNLGGIGYPSYTAGSAETDFNYSISQNTVTAWTNESTNLEKYQFLPYYVDVESNTKYRITYDVTGTAAENVQLSLYSTGFTGGNGSSSSYYSFASSGDVISVNNVDAGKAYLRLELLGDARNGKTLMISNIVVSKADLNELSLKTSTAYPANFTATSTVKTSMSYSANSTASLTVTSQYSTLTYAQKQLLPYYVSLKPNNTYVFNYSVSGISAENVKFSLVNNTFTGGNGSTADTYSFSESGSTITIGANDNGVAQLKVEFVGSVSASSRATITNMVVSNTDTKTTIGGKFSDTARLGIPVKEGYKFSGWILKSNDGSTTPYGSIDGVGLNTKIYEYTFGAGIDLVEAKWLTGTCKVIFRNYDGTVMSEQDVNYGSAATPPKTAPKKFAHTFVRWDTDYSNITKNVIIEPVFEEITIDVGVTLGSSTIYQENTTNATATFTPDEGSDISAVTWTTNKPTVATVSNDGVVTGVGAGTATITATVTYNGKTYKGSANVTVTAKQPASVAITSAPTKTSYFVGDTFSPEGMKIQVSYNNGKTSIESVYPFSDLPGTVTINNVSTATKGTKTVTVKYLEAGKTVQTTTKITVNAVLPVSVTITSLPTKTDYFVGDRYIDTAGISAVVRYNNGSTTEIGEDELEVEDLDSTTTGTKTITASYTEGTTTVTTTFEVTVKDVELSSIDVKTLPSKTVYYVGDTFDQSGLTINAKYNNGSTKTVTSGFTCTGFSSVSEGSKTITVEYQGKTTTFNVTVYPVILSSIAVKTNPTKTVYYVGDTFDSTGLTLTATYNSGKTETVTSGFTCSGFSSTAAGTKTITVTYQGKTATFNVTVNAVTLSSIAIKTNPTKLSYFVGESFDSTGLTLIAAYNNGNTETVTSGFTCSGFSSTAAGVKKITVTYQGKTATFNVTVTAVVLNSVVIKTPATKTDFYTGDIFTSAGLVLTANYSNGTSKDVSTGFTIVGYDMSKSGKQTVSVTFEGKTVQYTINVTQLAVESIAIKTNPTKTSYFVGDAFDATGLSITATYNSGKSVDVSTGFTTTGFNSATAGAKTITVTYYGKTTTFSVTVNAIVVTSIKVTTKPTKLSYETGDAFDATGMVVTATYNNGSSKSIASGYTVSGFDTNKAGTQTITVSYEGCSDSFTITMIQTYANYAGVDAAIAQANEKIATNLYTDESVAALKEAIAAVVRNLKADEQSTVDDYEANILMMIIGLEYKPADYSAVNDAITAANAKINLGIYTDKSVEALRSAINAVVNGKLIDEQDIVDGYAKAIVEMTTALVEKSADFSAIDNLMAEIEALDPTLYENYDEIYYGYIFSFYYVTVEDARATYTSILQQDEVDLLYLELMSYKDMLVLKGGAPVDNAKFEFKGTAKIKESGGVKYIVGVSASMTNASFLKNFTEYENVTVTFTKPVSSRYLGTGTVVTVKSDITNEVIGEYTIVIYGDINGDGSISTKDVQNLAAVVAKTATPTLAQKMASNVNGDRLVNGNDVTALSAVVAKTATINQETGKVVY